MDRNFRTGFLRYCWGGGVFLTCYRSVEYSEVPEKAYIFTFVELGSF